MKSACILLSAALDIFCICLLYNPVHIFVLFIVHFANNSTVIIILKCQIHIIVFPQLNLWLLSLVQLQAGNTVK